MVVEYEDETLPKKFRKNKSITFSSKFSCPESGFTLEEIEPRLFSFNSPYGACEECEGIGHNLNVDPNLVVPDTKKSLQDGAVEPWAKSTSLYYAQTLASIAKHYKFSLSDSWKKLSKKIQDVILYGSDEEEIKFSYDDNYQSYTTKKTFEGVVNNLERRYLETDSEWKREEIAQYQSESNCEKCKGQRLKEESLCVKINELNISDVTKKSIDDAKQWFDNLNSVLNDRDKKIATHILKEINERLNFLLNVGLNYLTLSRESGTLSGGEAQRINIARTIYSNRKLIFFDESLNNLDMITSKKILDNLKKMQLGKIIFFITHDLRLLSDFEEVLIFDDGILIESGSFSKLKENSKIFLELLSKQT